MEVLRLYKQTLTMFIYLSKTLIKNTTEWGFGSTYSMFIPLNSAFYMLNPRTVGGGDFNPPPLRFFADSEKTAARSAAKFAIAVQPTIWHISKKTTTRWPQRSRDQVAVSDLTSSCVFRSLTSCQRHTSDPNSLKLTMYSKSMGVYNLYVSDFFISVTLGHVNFVTSPL